LAEAINARVRVFMGSGRKKCDPMDALPRLLCLGAERRGKEGAGHGTEEYSTLHYSIT